MKKFSREETLRYGDRAKSLLEDEVLCHVLDTIKMELFANFCGAESSEERRNEMWAIARGLRKVEENFNTLISNAKLERAKMANEQKGAGYDGRNALRLDVGNR